MRSFTRGRLGPFRSQAGAVRSQRGAVRSQRGAVRSQRGAVSVEYLVILTVFMLGVALALASLGPGLVSVFQARVAWLALPFP